MIAKVSHRFGVLIAAHGGRDAGSHSNKSIFRLVAGIAARIADAQVGVGFINGSPKVDAAIKSFAAPNIIVYPLFMADGYFGRTALNRLVKDVMRLRHDRSITILPPLGLDPAIADLVVAKAASAVTLHGMPVEQVTLVLLAHGSRHSRNSASAAGQAAANACAHRLFADVRVAFLDEPPSLEKTVAGISGPVAVVGLFSGDGLHGGIDAARLMARLARNNVIYVGNLGLFSGLEKLIAAAVTSAMTDQRTEALA